jgi:glucose/arabinose dehydrogenase
LTHSRLFAYLALSLLLVCSSTPAGGALPTGFIVSEVTDGLSFPVAMAFAPDGRIFVTEQRGSVRVVKGGQLLPEPFVTVEVDDSTERGLLGVAFDPDFVRNQYVYVYYTTRLPFVHNRVSRFTAEGDRAREGSETVVMALDPAGASGYHNAGNIHFGPDGKLYIATGDSHEASNASRLDSLHGKILRINSDGTIPEDNPFYAFGLGNRRSIWAYGLRNPFSFAFDFAAGRMFINDVGEDSWEEINDGVAGSDYGWPTTEGPTSDPRFRAPIYAYSHFGPSYDEGGCAVTAGVFYRPPVQQFPEQYRGMYLFADGCNRWIRILDPDTYQARGFATNLDAGVVDLKVGEEGSLYLLERGTGYISDLLNPTGRILKIEYALSIAPRIDRQPAGVVVPIGTAAVFRVAASGTAPLQYQWSRDGQLLPGATEATLVLPAVTLHDNGAAFAVQVKNAIGSVTSTPALLTVSSDLPPVAEIITPSHLRYSGGDVIRFAGRGSDRSGGDIPPERLTWRVDLHHREHAHPFILPVSGIREGEFTVPRTGETSIEVWYRIYLTATGPSGLTHTEYRDVVPNIVKLTFLTSPPGLGVTLDGRPLTSPVTVEAVAGMMRTIGVSTIQRVAGADVRFESWSDGGAPVHNIEVPKEGAVFQADFSRAAPAEFATLRAAPNPVLACDGTALGTASLVWSVHGSSAVQLRLGAITGPEITPSAPGRATVEGVADGTTFYLQDVSGGKPLTAEHTLAVTTVRVTDSGCPPRRRSAIR